MGDPQRVKIPGHLAARLAEKAAAVGDADLDMARAETPAEAAEREAHRVASARARYLARVPVMYADAALEQVESQQARGWLTGTSQTLVLAGSVGVGKTHTAYAVANAANTDALTVEAWNVGDLLDALRPSGDPAVAHLVRRADLLVLDDLGMAGRTDWAAETLTGLVDARLREGRRQVVTTNAPYDALTEAWGQRLMDRLRYRWTVVTMTGESRRAAAW